MIAFIIKFSIDALERVAFMKKIGNWKQKYSVGGGRKRIAVRVVAALVLGAALFAGLAVAQPPAPQPPAQSPADCQSLARALAAAPDQLRHDGDTIGVGQIIRFRVIAASDSAFDQAVKLRVRDAVLDYLRPELQGTASEQAAAALISGRLPGIRQVAQQTVRASGPDKPVQVYYGVTAFPTKAYGPVVYPAGNYQALKIVIGAGQGKNWWCVLFPPLCYVDLTRAAQDLSGGQQIAPVKYPRLTTRIGSWLSGVRLAWK
ncbi:MAG: stage II sporulation protein R [Thermacetogeniaceae bacterium]